MKKGLIAIVAAAIVVAAGAGGYTVYQNKQEVKAYEEQMSATLSSLPTITVYEKEELPSIEEEFAGTENMIDINSVTPDISNVYTTEPGTYDINYTFKDTKGDDRAVTVQCIVKPELSSHVEGMQDIEIDKGDDVPEALECEFDEYVSSVTLNTDEVDNEEAGIYDISYTILGVNGDMKTVEGFTCTVNEVAPPPTPTPVPTKEPVEEETELVEDEEETEDIQEEVSDAEQEDTQNDTAMGNVEVQDNVVETGDENNIIAICLLIVVCVGAAVGVFAYRKKARKKS